MGGLIKDFEEAVDHLDKVKSAIEQTNFLVDLNLVVVFDDLLAFQVAKSIEESLLQDNYANAVVGLEIIPIDRFTNIEILLRQYGNSCFFLVDMKHGQDSMMGLRTIQLILNTYSEAFVVAYSSSPSFRSVAEKSGAKLFIDKGVTSWEESLPTVKRAILDYFNLNLEKPKIDRVFSHQDALLNEYDGIILDVNESEGVVWTRLTNRATGMEIERFFKIERFASVGELYVDKAIKLTQSEVTLPDGTTFTKTEFSPDALGIIDELETAPRRDSVLWEDNFDPYSE